MRLGISVLGLLATLAVALGTSPSRAQSIGQLYQISTIVTGQREETRAPALRQSLLDVLVRVSGDPSLINEPNALALEPQAPAFVDRYRYHDRLEGKPIHDEQGTRDRPHDLTIDFNPAKVDAALRSLGRDAWVSARPPVAIFLAVEQGSSAYVMTTDGERSYGQPDAFRAASVKTGMPIVLPNEAALDSAGLTFDTVKTAPLGTLDAAAASLGAEVALAGAMAFSDKDLGWSVEWRMPWKGQLFRWHVKGVSYDEAFRNALRGAAQILSGHGTPE